MLTSLQDMHLPLVSFKTIIAHTNLFGDLEILLSLVLALWWVFNLFGAHLYD